MIWPISLLNYEGMNYEGGTILLRTNKGTNAKLPNKDEKSIISIK